MSASETAKGPHVTSLRILVGFTLALAVVGVAFAGLLLARGAPAETRPAESMLGQAMQTSFGAFTVTNVRTTYVPDTQGPPSAAQHNGTNGTDQLQVWVRLVNERSEQGLAYSPSQLRLLTDAQSGEGQDPDGSSIKPAMLPRGGSIDGQVWFDLAKGARSTNNVWYLEFRDPGGSVVRVALGPPQVVSSPAAPSPSAGGGAGSVPEHDDSGSKH